MIPYQLQALAEFAQGSVFGNGDPMITQITTDSRKAGKGSLFACLKGERSDGHDYIGKAAENGAAAILCERLPENLPVPAILVPSALKALQDISREILQRADVPVITIGGSVGKTSTKEMIASVVSQKYRVHRTAANYNNELGLPLTIFGLEPEHEVAVLELGIDDFGQMDALAAIAGPDICVLTNIGDCHLEQLGDRDGVLRAKAEMLDHLQPGGSIVLNGDDEKLRTINEKNGVKPVFYGLGEGNTIRAEVQERNADSSRFLVITPDGSFPVKVNLPGDHMISNALAAAAVGQILGIPNEAIAAGIESYRSIDGRFNVKRTERYTVIDDCYNANPMSMKAALSALSNMDGRKVAILGDMGELGRDERALHRGVGGYAGSLPIDALYCTGELSREIADGAKEAAAKNGRKMEILHFADKAGLIEALPGLLRREDIILLKASHFMAFTEILALFMEGKL